MSDQPVKPVKAEIAKDGKSVLVTFNYNPAYVKAVKDVPTRRFVGPDKPEGPAWRVDLDLPTMRRLREALGDSLGLGPNLIEWGTESVGKERNLASLSDANDAELVHIDNGLAEWLRPYQRADIKFMAETNVICANQPRTGKTPTTIGAILEAEMAWGQHLVCGPVQSLRDAWENGILRAYLAHFGKFIAAKNATIADLYAKFDELKIDCPTVLTGDTPEERAVALREAKRMADEGLAFWLVINPAMVRMVEIRVFQDEEIDKKEFEALSTREQEQTTFISKLVFPELAEIDWDSITDDEFHLAGLSNPETQHAQGINFIAKETQPERRYALSGTPMRGKPIKLWGALHFLNPGEFSSKWNWARHWLVINSNDYGSAIEGIMPGREIDFYNHLKPYLVRRTQREALPGLPPKNRINVWCKMTSPQREQYTQMATEAEWALEDQEEQGRLTVTNVLAMYTRLKQFADAFCTVKGTGKIVDDIEKMNVQQTPESGKVLMLKEKLMEDNVLLSGTDDEEPKCALVASQFNPMCDMLTETIAKWGVPTERILSGKKARNDAVIKAFQTQEPVEFRGKTIESPRVLVMNTLMGTAITLDRAETVHILDEDWVPDDQEQMESRADPTTDEAMAARAETGIYYYRSEDSIEEKIQKIVADKAMNNKTILDLRRAMAKEAQKDEEQAA